jgi:hypothetical protein
MITVRGREGKTSREKTSKKFEKPLDKHHQVWYNKNVKRKTSYR